MSNLWCVFLLNIPKKPQNGLFWGIPLFLAILGYFWGIPSFWGILGIHVQFLIFPIFSVFFIFFIFSSFFTYSHFFTFFTIFSILSFLSYFVKYRKCVFLENRQDMSNSLIFKTCQIFSYFSNYMYFNQNGYICHFVLS